MCTALQDSTGKSRDCSLLLVEDNALNQKVVKLMLGKYGVVPEVANNGEEAIAKVQQGTFDLILMDLHMPGMHGVEAASRIRELLGESCPPIVALTADVYHASETDILKQGLNGFLAKPISSEKLRGCIEEQTGISLS
jgi:CheY-like chemotaxis protein